MNISTLSHGRLRVTALIYWFMVAVVVLVVAFILLRAFTALLEFDGGYNATVSKNLADGYGYLTTYQPIQGYLDRNREDPARLFSAEITTGPSVLLPVAFGYLVLGNKHWVPSLVVVLFNFSIFGMAIFLIRYWLGNDRNHWRAFLVVAVALLIASTTSVFNPHERPSVLRVWFDVIGEVPAAGFVILGALVGTFGQRLKGRAVLAGIIFGLAVQAKSLAILHVFVIVVLLALHFLMSTRSAWSTFIATLSMGLGYALPTSLHSLWMQQVMSAEDLAERAEASSIVFNDLGSGIHQFEIAADKYHFFVGNIVGHAREFNTVFSLLEAGFIVFICVVGVALMIREALDSRFGTVRKLNPVIVAGGALVLAALANTVWWILFEPFFWIRHLVQALVIFGFGLAMLVMVVPWPRLRVAVIGASLALAVAPIGRLAEIALEIRGKDPSLLAALEVAQVVEAEESKGAVGLGCLFDGNRQLELLQPGIYNYFDCAHLPPRTWGQQGILVQDGYWDVLVGSDATVKAFVEACDPPFLVRPPYTVRRCSDTAMKPHYLQVGFYPNADGSFWTGWTRRVAVMPLSQLGPPRDLALSLTAHTPQLETQPLHGRVSVEADETIWSQNLEFTLNDRRRDLVIPAKAMSAGRGLRIQVDRDFVPSKYGMGLDDRRLGVFLAITSPDGWRGFYGDSPFGRWMSGSGAIPVTPAMRMGRGQTIELYAGNPDLAEKPLIVSLRFMAGISEIAQRQVTLTRESALAREIVPVALARRIDRIELSTSRTFVPNDFGVNSDGRTLGVIATLRENP